uniref:Pheromone receptor n=1 Tax=Cyclocybe aegerita TaxID=1973307 RepID=A0A3S7H1T4_CYCAE|nr:pheromone receptor [Cyclocybe aegerita]
MDSTDFFQTISLSLDSSESCDFAAFLEFSVTNHKFDDSASSSLSSLIPVDSERNTGYTTYGFCVIA